MTWIAVGIAAVGVATSIYGASQSRKAGKSAEQAGAASGKYILEETAEETRRLRFEQSKTRATSRATIAASGFKSGVSTMGFSHKEYMKQLQGVQTAELAWLQKSGASRADIARRGGVVAGKTLKSQAVGLYGQALTSGLQGFQAYQNRPTGT